MVMADVDVDVTCTPATLVSSDVVYLAVSGVGGGITRNSHRYSWLEG